MIVAHERDTDESLAILTTLGLTPVINAAGSPSRLGMGRSMKVGRG
jgi:hypothetical protein